MFHDYILQKHIYFQITTTTIIILYFSLESSKSIHKRVYILSLFLKSKNYFYTHVDMMSQSINYFFISLSLKNINFLIYEIVK